MAQLARRRPTKHRQRSRRKNALPISSILQKKKKRKKKPPPASRQNYHFSIGLIVSRRTLISLVEEEKEIVIQEVLVNSFLNYCNIKNVRETVLENN